MDDDERVKALVARAVAGDTAALEGVVREIQDDVYNLAVRMLGGPDEAEDATQEILIQVVTHLGQWRAEASLRTWVWRIAVHHLLRQAKTKKESFCSFDALETAIAMGEANPPLPELSEAELIVLEKELRLDCTEAMILSLDREHRVAWILGEVFGVESSVAALVLEIDAATYRKRLQRARERLGRWMHENCGVANPKNPCSCRRQIPVAMKIGVVDPERLRWASHPERPAAWRKRLRVLDGEVDEIVAAAETLCGHPSYAAPDRLVSKLKEIVRSPRLRVFDA
jgi:RNA polymerase sigma factor (sigma-70 family)